jgi:hypothetical protein
VASAALEMSPIRLAQARGLLRQLPARRRVSHSDATIPQRPPKIRHTRCDELAPPLARLVQHLEFRELAPRIVDVAALREATYERTQRRLGIVPGPNVYLQLGEQ